MFEKENFSLMSKKISKKIEKKEKLSSLVIGDFHFKVSNVQDTDLMTIEIIKIAEEIKPDYIVCLGDTLDRHESIHVTPLENAIKILDALRKIAPLYILIGNHDRPNNSNFLTTEHPFTAVKHWENTYIADNCIEQTIKDRLFLFVPYVPPGRLHEALSFHFSCKERYIGSRDMIMSLVELITDKSKNNSKKTTKNIKNTSKVDSKIDSKVDDQTGQDKKGKKLVITKISKNEKLKAVKKGKETDKKSSKGRKNMKESDNSDDIKKDESENDVVIIDKDKDDDSDEEIKKDNDNEDKKEDEDEDDKKEEEMKIPNYKGMEFEDIFDDLLAETKEIMINDDILPIKRNLFDKYHEKLLHLIFDDLLKPYTAIYAHQEIRHAKMGAIISQDGDVWFPNWPYMISGHVHDYDQLCPNMLYTGTPIQHAYGDRDDKTISLVEWSDDIEKADEDVAEAMLNAYEGIKHKRININVPKKILIKITCEQAKTYKAPPNKQIKLEVSGTSAEIKSIIKHSNIKELTLQNVKIVYKDISILNTEEIAQKQLLCQGLKYSERLYKEIENDPRLLKMYNSIFHTQTPTKKSK